MSCSLGYTPGLQPYRKDTMPLEPYPIDSSRKYQTPTDDQAIDYLRWAIMSAFPMMTEKDIKSTLYVMGLVNESRT